METNTVPYCNKHDETCPTRIALDSLSAKWTVLVLLQLASESKRFGAIKREIEGISQKALTETLKDLESNNAITRTVYPTNPPQVEYTLTSSGQALLSIVNHVREWADLNINKSGKSENQRSRRKKP